MKNVGLALLLFHISCNTNAFFYFSILLYFDFGMVLDITVALNFKTRLQMKKKNHNIWKKHIWKKCN